MYTTAADYETYTGTTAPVDYNRQELYAVTLFKSLYPNFPSESQYDDLDTDTQQMIEYAIYEQIKASVSYEGTAGKAQSFSVGNFSITNGGGNTLDYIAFMAQTFLQASGATFKGVGSC